MILESANQHSNCMRPKPIELNLDQQALAKSRRGQCVHFSSKSDEWPTPQWLFDALDAEFGFTLDPCSTDENAKCRIHFTREQNGLVHDWSGASVFMNPPYGRQIGLWMGKAYDSAAAGSTVVCLVPARTDTDWWHRYAMKGEIRLFRGRIKFQGAEHAAPFPSALIVFRPRHYKLTSADLPADPRPPSLQEPLPLPPEGIAGTGSDGPLQNRKAPRPLCRRRRVRGSGALCVRGQRSTTAAMRERGL